MMDEEKKKMLRNSLEIIKKYGNENDSVALSSLMRKFDSGELDEDTFNEFLHNYYLPTSDSVEIEDEKNKERGAR